MDLDKFMYEVVKAVPMRMCSVMYVLNDVQRRKERDSRIMDKTKHMIQKSKNLSAQTKTDKMIRLNRDTEKRNATRLKRDKKQQARRSLTNEPGSHAWSYSKQEPLQTLHQERFQERLYPIAAPWSTPTHHQNCA